jgi:hypothetical protein
MSAVTDEDAVANDHLTRRERRVARSRGRRGAALAGWMGYGAGVFVVVTIAAWLAVGAGITPEPEPVARTTRTSRPEVALLDVTTTTAGGGSAPVAPVAVAEIPTTTTTSTTIPVLTAADTSGTTTPTP